MTTYDDGYNDGLVTAVHWLRNYGHEDQAQDLAIHHEIVIDGGRQVSRFPLGPNLEELEVPWYIEGKRYLIHMTILTTMISARREVLRRHGVFPPYTNGVYDIFTMDNGLRTAIDPDAQLRDLNGARSFILANHSPR